MSSGINWKFRIIGADPNEPPIQYSIGCAWVSPGEPSPDHEGVTIGLVYGLDAIRTAYSLLPGFSYNRELWLRVELSGSKTIAQAAASYLLDIAAKKIGKDSPIIHGGCRIETRTIGEWLEDNAFVCGKEIAAHAGVTLDTRFLDCWERVAIAAKEWPEKRWGICPKVTRVKVLTWGTEGKEVNEQTAKKVLATAEKWAHCVKQWGSEDNPLTIKLPDPM